MFDGWNWNMFIRNSRAQFCWQSVTNMRQNNFFFSFIIDSNKGYSRIRSRGFNWKISNYSLRSAVQYLRHRVSLRHLLQYMHNGRARLAWSATISTSSPNGSAALNRSSPLSTCRRATNTNGLRNSLSRAKATSSTCFCLGASPTSTKTAPRPIACRQSIWKVIAMTRHSRRCCTTLLLHSAK